MRWECLPVLVLSDELDEDELEELSEVAVYGLLW
jgi:hypothetical protein